MKLKLTYHNPQRWAIGFSVFAILTLSIMLFLVKDYSVGNDEAIHQLHGELILRHFQEGDSTAALSPFDSDGNIITTFQADEDEKIRGMNFFGGGFDLLVNALHPYFDHVQIYEFRHYLNTILGFLCMLFIALLVKEFSDWRWAILALLFAVLTPRLFGHSFNNPKDIPFAFSYIAGIYYTLRWMRALPKIRIYESLMLVLIIAFSISVRVSGLLLICYLGLAYVIYNFPKNIKDIPDKIKKSLLPALVLLLIITVGYASVSLVWPYMGTNIWVPIKVLSSISNFEVFNAIEIFKGEWINAFEIPKSYIPTWLAISLPIFVLIGFFAALPLLYKVDDDHNDTKAIGFLFFSIIFPVLFIILQGSNIYNGIRHLMFVIPPIITLSVLGWRSLFISFGHTALRYTLIAVLLLSIAESSIWMIKSHPYQALYFNTLSGGPEAAFGNYEIDYWGISSREAVEWIDKNTPNKSKEDPILIKMHYGNRVKVTNYFDSLGTMAYFEGDASYGFDYEIIYTAQAKHDKHLLDQWPPKNTVYEVNANGLPLCAVVKAETLEELITRLRTEASTENNYIELSLFLYKSGEYIECINESKKGLRSFPRSNILYNNIGSAFNAMEMYHTAAKYLAKSVELNKELQNSVNNLAFAKKNEFKPQAAKDYLNQSLYAYQTGDYYDCIWYAQQCLKLEKNAIAYNNMCSAYNALGNFKKAVEAGENAIRINPNFELAQRNLAYSKSKLSN
jgi:tetratricopeptide (TPR) repeat protein